MEVPRWDKTERSGGGIKGPGGGSMGVSRSESGVTISATSTAWLTESCGCESGKYRIDRKEKRYLQRKSNEFAPAMVCSFNARHLQLPRDRITGTAHGSSKGIRTVTLRSMRQKYPVSWAKAVGERSSLGVSTTQRLVNSVFEENDTTNCADTSPGAPRSRRWGTMSLKLVLSAAMRRCPPVKGRLT